jgi:hypothetical protein
LGDKIRLQDFTAALSQDVQTFANSPASGWPCWIAPAHQVTIYSNLEDFKRRLHQPREQLKFVVLKTLCKVELESIILLRDLLSDLRLILILPDHDEATVSLAHRLQPRFLSYADADLDGFKHVLSNMIRLYR